MTAPFRIHAGCYYLDGKNRPYGPLDHDAIHDLFTFKSGDGEGAFVHVWNAKGVAVGIGPSLVKEFHPVVLGAADFGVPSEQFGHLLEAIDQLVPGVQEDADNEIIAFSYEQFHTFCEKFGLLGEWNEKIKVIAEAHGRKEGVSIIAALAKFDREDTDLAAQFSQEVEELAEKFTARASKRAASKKALKGLEAIFGKMGLGLSLDDADCDCPSCKELARLKATTRKDDDMISMASDHLISSALASAMLSGKVRPDMSQDELLAVVLDEMADRMGPLGPSFKSFMQSRMGKKN